MKIPKELEDLEQPLKTLHACGNEDLLKRRKVSIVGARKTLAYSKNIITQLSIALYKRGVVTVSGGAMGIDAAAHSGAKDLTIAVMANGLDIIYPKVNQHLLLDIKKNALMLSEYEEGYKATKYSFVHRNRIVVALGEVLVVGEADLGSGSMKSIEYALKTKTPIYVIPHRLGESLATQELLTNNQATLITDIDSFADQFGEVQEQNEDSFLTFCKNSPTYEEAMSIDPQRVFELELSGAISIVNGRIILQ